MLLGGKFWGQNSPRRISLGGKGHQAVIPASSIPNGIFLDKGLELFPQREQLGVFGSKESLLLTRPSSVAPMGLVSD